MRSRPAIIIAMFALTSMLLFALASGCGGTEKSVDSTSTAVTSTTRPEPTEGVLVEVFFMYREQPATVMRKVEGGGPRAALEAMLEGPDPVETDQGIVSLIPEGTKLIGYSVEGDVATADFSEELLDYGGGSATVQAIREQVAKTVMANDKGVKVVRITVEGVPEEEALQP